MFSRVFLVCNLYAYKTLATTLSFAEFIIALGTATVIALGVSLTVTKMLIGQVLRGIKESEARQEQSRKESEARQEQSQKESEARQEQSRKEGEARHSADIKEIKSGMKQMSDRIDDLAHAMYDINGQLQRIVGYLGLEGIIIERKPRSRRRTEMPRSPTPPLSAPQ